MFCPTFRISSALLTHSVHRSSIKRVMCLRSLSLPTEYCLRMATRTPFRLRQHGSPPSSAPWLKHGSQNWLPDGKWWSSVIFNVLHCPNPLTEILHSLGVQCCFWRLSMLGLIFSIGMRLSIPRSFHAMGERPFWQKCSVGWWQVTWSRGNEARQIVKHYLSATWPHSAMSTDFLGRRHAKTTCTRPVSTAILSFQLLFLLDLALLVLQSS